MIPAHMDGFVDGVVELRGVLLSSVDPIFPDDSAYEPPYESSYDPNDPNLWLYRDRTLGMLLRYLRLSVEVERVPSLLGREFFRTRITSYSSSTFEDLVIFVHDVEQILEKLQAHEKRLIVAIVFQDYTRREAGAMLGYGERTMQRRFYEAVDHISELFLAGGLLDRLEIQDDSDEDEENVENSVACDGCTSAENDGCGKSCQEGGRPDFDVSDC